MPLQNLGELPRNETTAADLPAVYPHIILEWLGGTQFVDMYVYIYIWFIHKSHQSYPYKRSEVVKTLMYPHEATTNISSTIILVIFMKMFAIHPI